MTAFRRTVAARDTDEHAIAKLGLARMRAAIPPTRCPSRAIR